MDLRHLLAKEIADGIIATGVEGAFDSVSCSTAGNYPSMGVSQWEGPRGDNLLSWIDAGRKFMGRSYSDIINAGELYELKHILSSPQGQHAQREILAYDCLAYADTLMPLLSDSKCVIYAGIWCPTSDAVVKVFLENRIKRGYNVNNLSTLNKLFMFEYYQAAGVGEMYRQGYANRAENTYRYLLEHEIDWSVLDV